MKEQIAKLRKQLRALEAKEAKQLQDKLYPELAKKYNGKFFTYNNSSGGGTKWEMHVRVHVVLKNSILQYDDGTISFEVECDTYEMYKGLRGETEVDIKIRVKYREWVLQNKSSSAKFANAKRRIINTISK